jgi:hypothetical protein
VFGSRFVEVEQPVPKIHEGKQVVDFADGPPWVDAAQEQHFCSKYDPCPGQVPLVEQRLPDGPPRVAGQARHGGRRVPVRAEQVRAEVPDDLVLPRARQHLGDAELVPGGYPLGVGEQEPQPMAVP